jgi:hypothetical protein
MRTRAALLMVCALGGCGEQLEPAQVITNLRILGVKSEPPEGAVGADVNLTALVVDPDPAAGIDTLWLACVAAADVASPDDCLPAADAPPPPLCADDPEATLCAIGFGGVAQYRLPARARLGRDADEKGLVILTVISALTAEGGLQGCLDGFQIGGVMPTFCRIAVKQVAVLPDGAVANKNPGFSDMSLVGDDVFVMLADDSIEETPEGPEKPYISWFVTEGDVTRFRTDADEDGLSNVWVSESQTGRIFAVIRDGRGGEGWISRSR